MNQAADSLCRDCLHLWTAGAPPRRCPSCGSPRLKHHPELSTLSIAHIDCDSFYASVEKRDNPDLADKPVIVGGGQRGVVSAACYIARMYGVHSAMPTFKALKACPHAVVIKPNMEKYSRVGREIRDMMRAVTPQVEPISIDEAFLDLGGTERLHHAPPAQTLARLVRQIEEEVGVTASIGLSYNKFLAKVASDLEKPRGFSTIGEAEALDFLANKPVSMIWGVGKALNAKMQKDGLDTIGRLREEDLFDLQARYGAMGKRLYYFSRGQDSRRVSPESETKSISSETTFNEDVSDFPALRKTLWKLCEKVARRMKAQGYAARTVTLKLKTDKFKQITRSRTLPDPTQLAETLFRTGESLLKVEADGRRFRLIGIGGAELVDPELADPPDLADPDSGKRAKVEKTIDAVREKLGRDMLIKGREL